MHCVYTRPSPTDNAPKIIILKAIAFFSKFAVYCIERNTPF